MKIAFYAPMKPPDHPNPSGDRLMANNIIDALRTDGHAVDLVSRFRPRDPDGNPRRQERFRRIGAWHANRLIKQIKNDKPDVWLTYHLYYKTPDLLGPVVSDALEIPYAVVEASFAPKRADGPWAVSHRQVEQALQQADMVVFPNPADESCVRPILQPDATVLSLPPFVKSPRTIEREPARMEIADRHGLDITKPWLLTVGMMRGGDKFASYKYLADVCREIEPQSYEHIIVGDGVSRAEIERLYRDIDATFVGRLEGDALHTVYAASDVFAWPAVNEAWGMVFLEAQSYGLPVVAGRSGGVTNVVVHDESGLVVNLEDREAFSAAVQSLVHDAIRRKKMGEAGRMNVLNRHSFIKASKQLGSALEGLCK